MPPRSYFLINLSVWCDGRKNKRLSAVKDIFALSFNNLLEVNLMKRAFLFALSFFMLGKVAQADIQLYDSPPSAEEMGRQLFSKPSNDDQMDSSVESEVTTRSLSFSKKTSEPSVSKNKNTTSTAPVEHASTSQDNAIGLPIEFAYNSSQISESSTPFLTEIGRMLTLPDFSSKSLIIEGHTDAAGSSDYNLYLSKMRAEAIKQYLVSNYKVDSSRLLVVGLGESKPLPGKSPDDAVNRRVQLRGNDH